MYLKHFKNQTHGILADEQKISKWQILYRSSKQIQSPLSIPPSLHCTHEDPICMM